jgi:O-antigen ligase
MKNEVVKGKSRSSWFSAARLVLVATLVVVPLDFGADETWGWTSLLLMALVLLVLWTIGTIQEAKPRIVWSPFYIPAVFFLLLGMMQFFTQRTLNPTSTREAVLKLTTDVILFFVVIQLFSVASIKAWRSFGLAVSLFASSLSLFSIVQFLSGDGMIYWAVNSSQGAFGPYFNRDHYAGLMEMLIPLAAAYVLSRPEGHPIRTMLSFAVLLPVVSLLLAGSRGGLISFLAEVLVFGAIIVQYVPGQARRGVATAAGLGVTVAGALFFWIAPSTITGRLATVANLKHRDEVGVADRLQISRDSLRIFRDFRWIGTGMGSFETVYPQYQSEVTDEIIDHAHNDYAEALAEAGLVGGILILTSLVTFFALAFRNLNERLKHERGWMQLGATLGCCGLLVHSLVDFNLHMPANAAWFAVCAALASMPLGSLVGVEGQRSPGDTEGDQRKRKGSPIDVAIEGAVDSLDRRGSGFGRGASCLDAEGRRRRPDRDRGPDCGLR